MSPDSPLYFAKSLLDSSRTFSPAVPVRRMIASSSESANESAPYFCKRSRGRSSNGMSCTVGWYAGRAALDVCSRFSGADSGEGDGKASADSVTSNGSLVVPVSPSDSDRSGDGLLTIKTIPPHTTVKFPIIIETLHRHMLMVNAYF